MIGGQPAGKKVQRGAVRLLASENIADNRLAQVGTLFQCIPIGTDPATERAHHAADMFADNHVANADLPQLAVHVLDENLGQPGEILSLIVILFQPDQHQRENRCDHIETAVDTVRYLRFFIPGQLPPLADNRIVQRLHLCIRIVSGKNLAEKGHCWFRWLDRKFMGDRVGC